MPSPGPGTLSEAINCPDPECTLQKGGQGAAPVFRL